MDISDKKRRGRPPGIKREGTYGSGVKTKVVRVPADIADRMPEILATFELIKVFVDAWEEEMEENKKISSVGKLSPRYEKALLMLKELRMYLEQQ